MYHKNQRLLNNQISFVIQGPIIKEDNVTRNCCKSIRKFFPGSKIIISTWLGSKIDDLDFDKKVESFDPGAKTFYYHNQQLPNNVNRMIISSLNGLIAAKTDYSVKIRSDMYFENNNLSKILQIVSKSKSKFTKKKILIPSNMAINPSRDIKFLFHPSDSFFAGLTEDLRNLYDIPLMEMEDLNYYKNYKNTIPLIPRYTSEQYLFYSFIKKKIKINFKNAYDYNQNNRLIHDQIFSNLFIMKNNTNIGMNCYKYPMSFFSSTLYYAYSENEFKKLSCKHSIIDMERVLSNIIKYMKKISLFFISKKKYNTLKILFLKKFIN